MPEQPWPDVVPLTRPAPDLPLEAIDPVTASVDPLDLAVHDDRYQLYVRRHPDALRAALLELDAESEARS